jgi:hypothetical protein
MSGFVPKRVSMTRTAMGSTDANSSGKNGHSIVSTIGRRSTLRNKIQSRSFGSMWQIDYLNAAGNKCEREKLVHHREYFKQLTLERNTPYILTIYDDGLETKGFVRNDIQKTLAIKHPSEFNTDRYCAAGAINNNANKIVIGTGLYGTAGTAAAAGKEILAIGRWTRGGAGGGWNEYGLINGTSVYVAFSGSIPDTTQAPILVINDVEYNPASGPGTHMNTITNSMTGNSGEKGWYGALVGQFTIVMYGPGSTTPSLDDKFSTGFDGHNEKKITIKLK